MDEIIYCEPCDKDEYHKTIDVDNVECKSVCQVCGMETKWIKMSKQEFDELVEKATDSFNNS